MVNDRASWWKKVERLTFREPIKAQFKGVFPKINRIKMLARHKAKSQTEKFAISEHPYPNLKKKFSVNSEIAKDPLYILNSKVQHLKTDDALLTFNDINPR